jgi:glycosyltransferase involved in cell wall biosynthesis
MRRSFVLSLIEKLELRLYRSATAVVVLTESFRENLVRRGVPDEKISVVTNGVNRDEWRCADLAARDAARARLGLSGKFVLGYAGTMGMAHGLDFIISAARRLYEVLPDVAIVLIGDGAERERLEKRAKEANLANLLILPPVSKAELKPIMSAFDVSLVNLRRSDTFKTVLPSKIFESSAMGKPILLGVDGEARALVERYGAGVFFEPEDEGDFIEKVRLLKEDSARYAGYVRGGEALASAYSRDGLARVMVEGISGRVLAKGLVGASDVV